MLIFFFLGLIGAVMTALASDFTSLLAARALVGLAVFCITLPLPYFGVIEARVSH
jgi:hypothetical protein